MTPTLPINLGDLLRQRTVEGKRIEQGGMTFQGKQWQITPTVGAKNFSPLQTRTSETEIMR